MADWDEDSPRLRQNLLGVLSRVRDAAFRRDLPVVEDARGWQRDTMAGLDAGDPRGVGRFRGESGLERIQVRVGAKLGVPPAQVAAALRAFERTLQRVVRELDALYPKGRELDEDGLAAVIDLCAWAHAEWVRIHPFVNGNGRTARIWANGLLMRYGLPPAVRLRPRPDGGYGNASAAAMSGDWQPTARVFRQMLDDALSSG